MTASTAAVLGRICIIGNRTAIQNALQPAQLNWIELGRDPVASPHRPHDFPPQHIRRPEPSYGSRDDKGDRKRRPGVFEEAGSRSRRLSSQLDVAS